MTNKKILRRDFDPDKTLMHINVGIMAHLLYSFEADYGREKLVEFMNKTGLPVEYFENLNNWVSFNYYCDLIKKLVAYSGNPKIPFIYGLNTIKYSKTWGVYGSMFLNTDSPSQILEIFVNNAHRFAKLGKLTLIDLKKNNAALESVLDDNFKQDKNNCFNMMGQLSSLPTIFGLPYAEVEELQCAADGAESCIYKMNWQGKAVKKNNFFSLLIGTGLVYIIYNTVAWHLINQRFLFKTVLLLIPIVFFICGRFLDYIKTVKDNSEILDEQNKSIADSLNNVQKLNEDLQLKADQKNEELKIVSAKLGKTLSDLQKSEEELSYSEKLAGIGELSAGVAHEVNNPMGAVRNYLQDILEELPEDDARKNELIEAESSTKEAKTLINELLSFSRSNENLHITEIDINEVIEKILTNKKQDFINLNIKIYKVLTPGIPIIKSDAMQIDQVFANIISNSVSAIKQNGEIHLKTEYSDSGVHVEIRDNGFTIPPDILKNLSNPLDIGKNGTDNTRKDIGLAISSNIIERYNGEFKVKSFVGEGTVFNVTVPYTIV